MHGQIVARQFVAGQNVADISSQTNRCGQNVATNSSHGQNVARTKRCKDKTLHGQKVARTKRRTDKTLHGQNVARKFVAGQNVAMIKCFNIS